MSNSCGRQWLGRVSGQEEQQEALKAFLKEDVVAETHHLLLCYTQGRNSLPPNTAAHTSRVSGQWRSGCRAAANSIFGEIEEELLVKEIAMSQQFDPPQPLRGLTARKR